MTGEDDRDTARTFPGELRDPKGTLDRVSESDLNRRGILMISLSTIWFQRIIQIMTQT